jgi:molybdopterin molybdotransferase
MSTNNSVSGLILAGGQGTRMGSVDKGLVAFRGSTMAAHVMARLAPQVSAVAINANRNLPTYQAMGVPVWPDELGGFAGPLAGLQTGLRHCGTDYLVCVPCDSPLLPTDLVDRLMQALQAQQADLALAVTLEADAAGQMYKQTHPVFCLLKKELLPVLSAYLQEGGRRMDGWHAGIKVAEVLFDDASAFRNINTREELNSLDTPSAPKTLASVVSCLSGYDPDALPVRQAQRIIGDFITPVRAVEKVALRSALDRVLAADIESPIDVPAHDNSAMDGYALCGSDLAAAIASIAAGSAGADVTGPQLTLSIAGTVYAGRPFDGAVGAGQCVRIMTGGVMPAGCDSVVPQEFVSTASDTEITFPASVIRTGDNRRLRGEDLKAGSPALRKGKILRPADLGLLASLGIAEVPVQRRLRVAFFSTGDELRSIGETLDAGCVYDSNRYTLFGMLKRLGCDIIDMGIVRDDPQALEDALRSACENADAIITSGGVSVGAADYTKQIMAELGDVTFWKIGMRPGRPMAFGQISSNGHSAFLFGLPGNPVAVMVTFYFFARGALLRMMGADPTPAPLLSVASAGAIRKKAGRTEYQRGILAQGPDGRREVRLTGAQGSGILRSMSEANCMVVLHDEQGNIAAGDMVDVFPFEGLI